MSCITSFPPIRLAQRYMQDIPLYAGHTPTLILIGHLLCKTLVLPIKVKPPETGNKTQWQNAAAAAATITIATILLPFSHCLLYLWGWLPACLAATSGPATARARQAKLSLCTLWYKQYLTSSLTATVILLNMLFFSPLLIFHPLVDLIACPSCFLAIFHYVLFFSSVQNPVVVVSVNKLCALQRRLTAQLGEWEGCQR